LGVLAGPCSHSPNSSHSFATGPAPHTSLLRSASSTPSESRGRGSGSTISFRSRPLPFSSVTSVMGGGGSGSAISGRADGNAITRRGSDAARSAGMPVTQLLGVTKQSKPTPYVWEKHTPVIKRRTKCERRSSLQITNKMVRCALHTGCRISECSLPD